MNPFNFLYSAYIGLWFNIYSNKLFQYKKLASKATGITFYNIEEIISFDNLRKYL